MDVKVQNTSVRGYHKRKYQNFLRKIWRESLHTYLKMKVVFQNQNQKKKKES